MKKVKEWRRDKLSRQWLRLTRIGIAVVWQNLVNFWDFQLRGSKRRFLSC